MIVERAEDLTYDELNRLRAYNERLFNYVKSFMLSGRNGVLCLLGAKGIGKTFNVMKALNSVVAEDNSLSPYMIIYRDGGLRVLDPLKIASEDVWGSRFGKYKMDLKSVVKNSEILVLDDIHYMVGDTVKGFFDRELFKSTLFNVMDNLDRKIILISEDPLPYYSKVLRLDDLNDFLVKLGLSPEKPNPTSLTPIPPLDRDTWENIVYKDYKISFKDKLTYNLIYFSLPTPRGVLRLVNLLVEKKILKEDGGYEVSMNDVMRLIKGKWISYEKQLLKKRRGLKYSADEIKREYGKYLIGEDSSHDFYYDFGKETLLRVKHSDVKAVKESNYKFKPQLVNWLRNLCYDVPTRHYIEKPDLSTRRVLNMIDALAEKYHLPSTVISTSYQMLKLLDKNILRRTPRHVLAFALIYSSAEYLGFPISKDIIFRSLTEYDVTYFKRIHRMISFKLNKKVVRGLSRYMPDFLMNFPYDVVSEAYELIKDNRLKLQGKKPALVWLGMIYLIMKKRDPNYTVQDVGSVWRYSTSRWAYGSLLMTINFLRRKVMHEEAEKKVKHENVVKRYLIEFKTIADRSYNIFVSLIEFDRLDEHDIITRYYIVSDKELRYFRKIPNSKVKIITEFRMRRDVEVPDEVNEAEFLSKVMSWVDKAKIGDGGS